MNRLAIALVTIASSGLLSGQESVIGTAQHGPLSPDQRIHHVLSRLTLGPTPELMAEVREKGIDAWIEEQLTARLEEPATLNEQLAKLKSLTLDNRQIMDRYVPPLPMDAMPDQRRQYEIKRNIPYQELLDSVLLRAIYSKNQVQEVASDFFRNHFAISVDKNACRYYATEYEREVIRKHALGSFADMLIACAHSPAMLTYLDNALSRRPLSKTELKSVARKVRQDTKSREQGEQAADIAKQSGLNENYARELLELHTLGVDNYYTQKDVIAVAEALTGWTFCTEPGKPLAFMYRGDLHVDAPKKILGKTVKADSKEPTEGDAVLEMLITHQGTARFLSWKLCRWLVSDDPPEEMVKRIEQVFWKTRGDMKATIRAIVADPDFFDRSSYQVKFKRPFELVVSTLRATGAEIKDLDEVRRRIEAMSEPYYRCNDPTGFYDQAEAWLDPGAIAVRWKFALDLATGRIKGVKVPASLFEGLGREDPKSWKHTLADRLLPGGLSQRTSAYIDGMIEAELKFNPFVPPTGIAPKIVGAILGSPDFQKQ